jgi:hypothetical protein
VSERHGLCPGCGSELTEDELKDSRRIYCFECARSSPRRSILKRYGSFRNYKLMQKYGIDVAEFDRLVAAQGDVCAICEKRSATQVDHDHMTGKVRGVLCLECNAAIGAFKDSVRMLYRAIHYLDPIPIEELAT